MKLKLFGTAVAVLISIALAFANAVFTLGNHPQPDEDNILFTTDQTGTTVNGFTNPATHWFSFHRQPISW